MKLSYRENVMPTVWVVNKSSHDYSAAEKFGTLDFLSQGPMDKFAVNDMDRQFADKLRHSTAEDYILLTALSVMNALACTCFALKHGRLNLLIYKSGEYVERRLVFADLREE